MILACLVHASINICRHLDIVEMFFDEIKVQEKLVIMIADCMKLLQLV